MASAETANLAAEMNGVAAIVVRGANLGVKNKLSKDAAALSAMIGVLSYIRVEGLNEEAILRAAKRAVPENRFVGQM